MSSTIGIVKTPENRSLPRKHREKAGNVFMQRIGFMPDIPTFIFTQILTLQSASTILA